MDPKVGAARPFLSYAALSLVAVVGLGVGLGAGYRSDARARGVEEGRIEATLVANTAVGPLLDGSPLSSGLTPMERVGMQNLVGRAIADKTVLRLRLRDRAGQVVFSDDGSGFGDQPESEALEAAAGASVARLTRLNADSNDSGPAGPAAVEVYQPLTAGPGRAQVGVLEVYMPYAPISQDIHRGLTTLYGELAVGLLGLYVVLFLICASATRGLRRQLAVNSRLALHDSLTDLPNRESFHRSVERAVADAHASGHTAAIAIFDLDRFKDVNDTLGHQTGDDLLRQVAERFALFVGPGDTVARLGGDEFGVIFHDGDGAAARLAALRARIDHDIEVQGLPLSVEASVGFVLAPEDGGDVDTLLQRADVAMYVSKARHGIVRYNAELDHYDATNLSLIAGLRHAIEADELVLHYQPKCFIANGAIEAVEALVRWDHPTLGLLPPDRFLPMAEHTELIDKLTDWVVQRALTDIRDLPGGARLAVAVNVSARNLTNPDFAPGIIAALQTAGVGSERLIVELTETALLVDPRRAATALTDVAAAGVRVSLDDFGAGQTSLGYLSALPISELKVDRSFIADMTRNGAHAAIVRSIVELGHNLSMVVVGEGVETPAVLESLRATGCDVAQGFLFARPMPINELAVWLTGTKAAAIAAPAARV